MSRIGKYKTSMALEEILVDPPLGKVVSLFPEDTDLEVEIECVLHHDGDGEIEAEISSAKIFDLELSQEAIDALNLEERVSLEFFESSLIPPKPRSVWRDQADYDWVVIGTGREEDQASGDMVLMRRIGHFSYVLPPFSPEDARTGVLVPLHELTQRVYEEGQDVPKWRRVVFEDAPEGSNFSDPGAVYVGKK